MKKIYSIILAVLVSAVSFAQTKVSGVVKDSKGEPVIGAAVQLKTSSTVGVVTDLDGRYTITLPAAAKGVKQILVFSSLSYETQEIDATGKTTLDVVLSDDSETLDEVVVVGYGSMRRSDLTGSVASVKISEDESAQKNSIDELLQGKAAGVQVLSNNASPDAGVSIRIRGLNSFNSGSEPLYVIDGVIMNVSTSAESLLSQGADNEGGDESTNGLMGLNPQDIESMEILKDASATAIYGAEGANGVVLITTKSATKDRPTVNVSAGIDISERYKTMPVLDFYEYADYYEMKGGTMTKLFENPETRTGLKVSPINWQDYMMRTGVSQRYYVSITGKPKQTSYLFSFGYRSKQGIVRKTDVDQYTLRLNLDRNVTKTLKIGTKSSFAFVKSNLTQGASTGRITNASSIMRSMVSYKPYRSMTAEIEEEEEDIDDDDEDSYRSSPEKWLTEFSNTREEIRITPSIYAQWKISNWLSFKSTFGADYRRYERTKYKSYHINSTTTGSNGAIGDYQNVFYNWDNFLMFNKKIKGGHRLSGTLGQSYAHKFSSSQTIEGWNVVQFKAFTQNLNSAPNTSFSYSENASATLSFFARGIYNYKDRYVLTATYRLDGSSKFAKGNRWGRFPSFALAWRVNQEPWFNADAISMFKVRLGWGRVGNQSISSNRTISNYNATSYPDHTITNTSTLIIGSYSSNLANADLKWETTEQLNAGVDYAMFQGRMTLSVDAYNKTTFDLLQAKPAPLSGGYSSVWVNSGNINNRGIEFSLDTTPLKAGGFEWSVNGNISFNRNQVVEIGPSGEEGEIYLSPGNLQSVSYFYGNSIGNGNYANGTLNIFIKGQPMGLFYGYKTDGIILEGESGPGFSADTPRDAGSVRYVDLNGNGYIEEQDRTIIGDPNPDFTYGFGTNFSWKGLNLSVNFNGAYGNDIYNVNYAIETTTTSMTKNIYRDAFYNAWTPDHPERTFPAIGKFTTDDCKWINDRFVQDGSYLRLSSVRLSYKIPMPKNSRIVRGINVGVSANNLKVWTTYPGWDPEVNSYGADVKRMGVDVGSYPSARNFGFDVKLTF